MTGRYRRYRPSQLYLLEPAMVVAAYLPGLVCGMFATKGMGTPNTDLVYPHFAVYVPTLRRRYPTATRRA